MDRNDLAHTEGCAMNPILAAMGYNFRLLLKGIRLILCLETQFATTTRPPRQISVVHG